MRRLYSTRTMLLGLFLVVGFALPVRAAITKGPYLQNPSPTAVTVQWETDEPGEPVVRFCPAAEGYRGPIQTAAGRVHEKVTLGVTPGDPGSPAPVFYLYRARLENLAPNTEYRYWVENSVEGKGAVASEQRIFCTWPAKAERVTFIAYGDTRSNPEAHRAVARHFNSHSPDFILHTGDCVSSGNVYQAWGPEFFAPLADVLDHVPMMIARGNHEGKAENVLRLFDMPEGRTWYSFDYGPVHVVVLDSYEEGKAVLDWLEKDLAGSTAPWKIAAYHEPTFNLGGHRSAASRTTFLPLFEKYGVDVVLAGHSHIYERFRPLRRAGVPGARPITFITTGGGGGPLHDIGEDPILAKTAEVRHYCLFTADAERLSMKAFTDEGRELDAFTVSKKEGRYDEAYLAQARPMEAAILAQASARLGPPVLATLPSGSAPVAAVLKVDLPGLGPETAITVRVAHASAESYAAEPVALKVRAGKSAEVRLLVRALKPVTTETAGKEQVLRPPLRFAISVGAADLQEIIESSDAVLKPSVPPK
ncbi:MAG TPA: metallophosphoesterase family protein [Phycisphaerae bacterium]|nr:metallophosphoesterase family protein [Phycisphaerae bacterium]